MTNHSALARIEDEAATWVVVLADEPDDAAQQRQFEIWLNTSAVHADVWARTCHAYERLGAVPSVTQAQWPMEMLDEHRETQTLSNAHDMAPYSRTNKKRYSSLRMHFINWLDSLSWKSSLGGLTVSACLMLAFLFHLPLHLSADHVSGTGEQKIHVLDDGSKVTLAPESAVDIDYSGNERRVRLRKGAAFFEVQRDTERPFSVEAGGVRTTVLGTAFNVNMTDSGTVVSVAHGHVRVEDRRISPAVSENLTAGDQLAVTWGEGANLTRSSPEDVARWRKGELVARNLPVSEVVDSFRGYYSGIILVTEPFASQRVTGLYRLNAPVSTLADMAEAHGATARRVSPWLLILSQ